VFVFFHACGADADMFYISGERSKKIQIQMIDDRIPIGADEESNFGGVATAWNIQLMILRCKTSPPNCRWRFAAPDLPVRRS
jgi:hypothetical protein